MSDRISIIDSEVVDDDHLRLPIEALHEVGEAAQVLAAIWTAAGERQGRRTFASYDKLAAVACCCCRTVARAVADDGPLVQAGYIGRHGREPIHKGTDKKRRTVTLSLTRKAAGAFTRYLKLPRVLVHLAQQQGRPLRWCERAVLAAIISRHTLIEHIVVQEVGCIDDRDSYSIRQLMTATGLTRHSVIAGRRGLADRKLIEVFAGFDDGHHGPVEMFLNNTFMIRSDQFPAPAVGVLKVTDGPPRREWQEPLAKAVKKSRPVNVSDGGVQTCPTPQCKPVREVVQTCPGGSANLSVAINESSYESFNESLLRNPLTKHPKQVGVLSGGCSKEGEGASQDEEQRRFADLEMQAWKLLTPQEQAAYHNLDQAGQRTLLASKAGSPA